MATEAEIGGIISPTHLTELFDKGFTKLVGIDKDGQPTMKWTPIYDNPNYWTKEKLIEKAADFKEGVGTIFGNTGFSDDQGPLYNVDLDIDCDAVYDKLIILQNPGPKCSLTKNIFEQGCVVKTKKPKGFQIHWRSHKQHKPIHTQDCKPGFEFEIKTDKSSGLGTLPPSTHRNDPKFEYKWEARSDRIPISDDFYDIVLEVLNDCLVQKPLNGYQSSSNGTKEESKQDSGSREHDSGNGNGKSDGLQLKDDDVQKITESIQPYYRKGCRNAIVLGLSGPLRKEGISKDSVIAVIEKLARNDGISDEADVRKAVSVVEETFKKDIGIISGMKHFQLNVLLPITGNYQTTTDILGKISKVIRDIQEQHQDKSEKEDDVQWLRRNIMAEYAVRAAKDNKELFVYDNGVYLANHDWCIEQFCQSIRHDVKTNIIDESIKQVKRRTFISRSKFDSNIDILNLKNGLLNIITLKFTEHRPDHYSTIQLPIEYDSKAKCPNIVKFIREVVKPKDIRTTLQLFGYCLYMTQKFEKIFFLVGSGANGKSTFIHLLEAFLGLDNISHESLQNLAKTRWSAAQLFGKSANVYADLGREVIKDAGIIKMFTSGDWISAENKNQQKFQFKPFAKLVYSANELPEFEDKTYALQRRLIILPFENTFEENKDTCILDKITTQAELSGLLNLALIGLKQLIKDDGFVYVDDIKTVAKEYILSANSVARFLEEKCLITGEQEDFKICRDLWGAYHDFCDHEHIHCESDTVFGKKLPGNIIRRQKRFGKGQTEWCYFGIRLKDETNS